MENLLSIQAKFKQYKRRHQKKCLAMKIDYEKFDNSYSTTHPSWTKSVKQKIKQRTLWWKPTRDNTTTYFFTHNAIRWTAIRQTCNRVVAQRPQPSTGRVNVNFWEQPEKNQSRKKRTELDENDCSKFYWIPESTPERIRDRFRMHWIGKE